jgi:hypothetical protein
MEEARMKRSERRREEQEAEAELEECWEEVSQAESEEDGGGYSSPGRDWQKAEVEQ